MTTDRRSYHLQLESTDRTYMAAISWTYPQDGLVTEHRGSVSAAPVSANRHHPIARQSAFRLRHQRRQSAVEADARIRRRHACLYRISNIAQSRRGATVVRGGARRQQ
ncbi:MAG: TrbG/VirB9 family P-type conjugative transfer protein [Rhizomicrobium sp.]